MGWRGTVRSISAAVRAAERDAERRRKAQYKLDVARETAAAVREWEANIDDLVSIHVDTADAMDWHEIAASPKPVAPDRQSVHEHRARRALDSFKPSFVHKVVGGSQKRRAQLEADLVAAPGKDDLDYEKAQEKFLADVAEWEDDTALARRLMTGEADAIRTVIEEAQTFSETSLIGTSVGLNIGDSFVHAKPVVHSDEIVPNFRRKQLASGRLSETKMPVGQFNELYQDYVASVALKVAGDLFHILPLDEIYVTCVSDMLNPTTGHLEHTPILSVQFVRDTFVRLNLASLDPSDSMANFNHAMAFSKTKGFSGVKPLKSID